MTPARRRLAVAAALLAVTTAPAAGQGVREACAADVETHCAGIKPGGGRILNCLKSHADRLAPACMSALEKIGERMKGRRG